VGDRPRICLVSASEENVFFGEILEAFGEALALDGFEIERSVDCFPPPAEDLVYLYIPHEYTALVEQLAHPTAEQLGRSVAISTEQPGTSWFEQAFVFARQSGAVVDINPLAAEEMRRRGVAAEHAPLGYIPSWDVWGGNDDQERPIDLAFLGSHTPERARTIARCSHALRGQRRGALYLTETNSPHTAGSTYYLAGERRARLLAESKLLLNIHQQKLPYLEWHRFLSAVLNGCVVLTEHSLMTEPFKPGVHFISAREDDLPFVLEALLADEERLATIRGAAYDLVREQMPMSRATAVIERAVEKAHAHPLHLGPVGAAPAVPLPKPLEPPPPGWMAYIRDVGEQLPTRRALMDLMNRTRNLERRLGEISGAGADDEVTVEEFGREGRRPRISVLLTVYNHAELAPVALRSVAASEFDDEIEVIVVDDASVDDSVEALRRTWAEFPWLSGKLISRRVNGGLPASSRNLAFEHATGDLLFILDADNLVLPRGLAKLSAALDDDRAAAFSYGIIEKFDGSGPLGIESWLEWDPGRLRYKNYIDAMALIRREQFEEVGGYPTEPSLAGWEDYALWAAMAEAGMHGVRVPDFVGRYRVSQHSMLSIIAVDHSCAWNTLLRKYPMTMRIAG
jgi:hypothetical protein